MTDNLAHGGKRLRRIVVLALVPPLAYCVGLLFGFEDRLPPARPWLFFIAMAGALLSVLLHFVSPRRGAAVSHSAEIVLRYGLALLLVQFALNKLIPGQFLLYNRDLDLPLREVPERRLAWHFLGHSSLYNGFIASVELAAGLLLCSRRTVVGGVLLSLGALVNIVVIDVAFAIRGALPIATVMACAALALAIVYIDRQMLQSLVWRSRDVVPENRSLLGRAVWSVAVSVVLGLPLYMNLATRRGLGGQVPPTGRWEVLECTPNPGVAICQSQQDVRPAVLYLEIGQWGQFVAGAERRDLSFSYDKARGLLAVRIAPSDSALEPGLVLSGRVGEGDTTVILHGQRAGGLPFQVRVKRTRPAPWPPVRGF